jgi:transposase
MIQEELFKTVPVHRFSLLSKEEQIQLYDLQQKTIEKFADEITRLRALNNELEQKSFFVDEQLINIKNKLFGRSSEKEPSGENKKKAGLKNKGKKKKVQLPSQRYPDAPLIERDVTLDILPSCNCCGKEMEDSGMTANSEYLTTIPAQYIVILQKRHIYECGDCETLVTAPCPPRIKPGGSYSDEMIIDLATSKYCDLIPLERYSAIAGREGLDDLPPHSLIEQTHYLADFVEDGYNKLRDELSKEKVLHADETPHKMLEGSKKKNWYLWGFSSQTASYFEIHNTRSGDVASDFLKNSKCEYLMSDVFSGYAKAVRTINDERKKLEIPLIQNIYCNAHARRYLKKAKENFQDESKFFIDLYKKIYRLENIAKERPPNRVLRVRRLMAPLFEKMKNYAITNIAAYSSKSSIAEAMSYFLKNYKALTMFIENKDLPIDNNLQESLLRNPVIGRKTWYGTHSKRGAKTAAILFSLIESCKLNKVNPREYFKKLVSTLHFGKDPFTPREFKDLKK